MGYLLGDCIGKHVILIWVVAFPMLVYTLKNEPDVNLSIELHVHADQSLVLFVIVLSES